MPHRAGGGVARVRERWLLAFEPFAVRGLERRGRQIHLAADIDAAGDLLTEGQRDRLDGAEVGGDVLADRAVATGRALGEAPIHVRQVDRETIDLELACIPDVVAPERLPDALVERADLGFVERVREREHRVRVLDRREAVRRRDTDALRR